MRGRTIRQLTEAVQLACKRMGVGAADAEQIAVEAVRMIVAEYGGVRLYIPMLEVTRRVRDEAIIANLRARRSVSWCAQRFNITKNRVRQIYAKAEQRIGADRERTPE